METEIIESNNPRRKSSGWNPCSCWNLKDGCVTIGIWTLIFSLVQFGIFGWQTADIKYLKDKEANVRIPPESGSYGQYDIRYPGYYERYYESPRERWYTGLFVIQIIALIASFFLLFASVSLIYGIHTNSKYLIWPWFPCISVSILCSLAYCIMWWTGDVKSYWLVLTIIELLAVIINVYCLLCVIAQYNRVSNGIIDPLYYQQDYRYYPDKNEVYQGEIQQGYDPNYDPYKERETQGVQFVNDGYETDPMGRRVQIFNGYGNPQQREMADELPPKAPVMENVVVEESNVQHWLQNQDQPVKDSLPVIAAPIKAESISVIDEVITEKPRKHKRHSSKDKPDRSKHRDRAESVGSKSTRSHRRTSDSSLSDSDSDRGKSRKKHRRDRSGSKHQTSRHRSHSRGDKSGQSDTDTGYSRSEHSTRHKHREKSDDERNRRHRRPRDVKRDNKERRANQDRPQTSASDPNPHNNPQYSPFAGNPAAISIPQSIVIPPSAKGKEGQPRRYHIENSITISYSDKSSNPSEHGFVPVHGVNLRPLPPPHSATPPQRTSFGNESMDSRTAGSQGATAV